MEKVFRDLVLYSVVLVSSVILGCGNEQTSILKCHSNKTWDSLAVARQLTGTWKWKAEIAAEYYYVTDKYEGLTVIFYPDKAVRLYEDDVFLEQATWSLESAWKNTYQLRLDQNIPPLYSMSIIYLCEEEVMFSLGHLDGSSHYFQKKEPSAEL